MWFSRNLSFLMFTLLLVVRIGYNYGLEQYGSFNTDINNSQTYIVVKNNSLYSGNFTLEYMYSSDSQYCKNDPSDLSYSWIWTAYSYGNITWDTDSMYQTEINYSITKWEELGLVDFVNTPSPTMYISDYYDDDGSYAHYNSLTKDIKLNKFHFDNMSPGERYKTIMHELGHSLGLDHMDRGNNDDIFVNESETNVMYSGKREVEELGGCDKYVYFQLFD